MWRPSWWKWVGTSGDTPTAAGRCRPWGGWYRDALQVALRRLEYEICWIFPHRLAQPPYVPASRLKKSAADDENDWRLPGRGTRRGWDAFLLGTRDELYSKLRIAPVLRTHNCGELGVEDVDQTVTLCGWVDSSRDHGGAVFFDLRDRYGKTQVVAGPESGREIVDQAGRLRSEFVMRVTGRVAHRPAGTVNSKLSTGAIELRVTQLEVLNASGNPPFTPAQQELPGEDIRLRYRYIDLRRPEMQRTLVLRSRIIKAMRDYFDEHQFIDVETPVLGRSTPEGARDYLVPSRIHRGKFYALPQSPQLYKQILMVAGYDRYVQVARCFRDEDLRADRQPEFTQLDMEMSFVDANDVMSMIDGLVVRLAREILGLDVQAPLPRMTYDEAMRRYGHDAPDLRFGMELVDCTDLAAQCEFRVFHDVAQNGGFVRGIRAPRRQSDFLANVLTN